MPRKLIHPLTSILSPMKNGGEEDLFSLARQWFDGNRFFDALPESNHFLFI
jgi:hypothetical protein